jgi:hypothetical protein
MNVSGLSILAQCCPHKTENEDNTKTKAKTSKNTTQKTKKMSNTDSNKIPGVNTVLMQEG